MGLTDWAGDHLFALTCVALASGTVAVVSALGIVGWLFLAVFVVGADGAASTLGALLPVFLVAFVVSLPVALAALVGLAVGLLTRAAATAGRSGGIVRRIARFAERHNETARLLGVSDLVAEMDTRTPRERADDRIDALKDRYVSGDLSQSAFERRVRDVLDDEGVDRTQVGPTIDDRLRESGRD